MIVYFDESGQKGTKKVHIKFFEQNRERNKPMMERNMKKKS